MPKLSLFACFFLGLAVSAAAQVPIHGASTLADKRVMILGDSLTQDGRYVALVEYYLEKYNPRTHFDIVNAGLASETTSGLTEEGHPGPRPCILDRIDRALADVKPELVIACYGMNDGIYKPLDPDRTKAFQDGMTRFVDKCHAAGAKVILITPPTFETDAQGGVAAMKFDYNQVLDAYADWEIKTRPGGATVVDLHFPMNKAVATARQAGHPLHGNGDGAHPNEAGYFLMGNYVARALNIPVPSQTFEAIQADPLYKLIHECQDVRASGWLEYIGYTRVNKTTPPHLNDIVAVEKKVSEMQKKIDELRRP